MMEELLLNSNKPYRVMTYEGDYFFYSKKKAKRFAKARNGFFMEQTIDQQIKGGDNYFKN